MATLTEKLKAVNNVPLDGIIKRIDALRAQAEADLKRASQPASPSPASPPGSGVSTGLTAIEFMTALERAKKTGLS